MTANDRWTVYTVDTNPDGKGFDILAVLWTDAGPQDASDAGVEQGGFATRDEAERQAEFLQQSYDRLRRAMLAGA